MKGILGLLARSPETPAGAGDSVLFSSAFAAQEADVSQLVPWHARAVEVGAQRLSRRRGGQLLQALWARDRHLALLGPEAMQRLARFFDFAAVPAARDVIRQDEYGNFMVVVLTGTLAIERVQDWGEPQRLAETRPGDLLGEMSLIDSGMRLSSCTTLTDCELAVLGAEAMDEMMAREPQLAASVVALLARRLARRLRVASARLGDNRR